MTSQTVRRAAAHLALATGVLVLLGACSGSASVSVGGGNPNAISKQTVEDQAATQIANQTHQPKPTVTCPGPLEAKVGATLDCTLVAQGDTTQLPVHLVVDAVNGGTANFSISVGSATSDTTTAPDSGSSTAPATTTP